MKSIFTVIGVPLQENQPLPLKSKQILEQCDVVVGESRKSTHRLLSKTQLKKEAQLFLMDNMSTSVLKDLEIALRQTQEQNGNACLFSDTGMPILFDPGREVLGIARRLGFSIRCEPGPTSWGTACALSGWTPPFLVAGFPPAKTLERQETLRSWAQLPYHLVLMDTPYRFQTLIKDCQEIFGAKRQVFLAWEIGSAEEVYSWSTFSELTRMTHEKNLVKGEFILIVEKAV